MSSCEWSLFLNALSISIAQDRSADELAFLSLIFSQLSTSFALLAVSPPGCSSNTAASQSSSNAASSKGNAATNELLLG